DYDDGFVAYLNGTEISRSNVNGEPVFGSFATQNHEAGSQESIDITAFKNLLQPGDNMLAVVGLNVSLDSSDFSLNPEVVALTLTPGVPAQQRIRSVDDLQRLVHLRGTYSRRQLQAVLGEFWENHFTTDYDKVQDYFDD